MDYLSDVEFCKGNEYIQIFTNWLAKNKAANMLWSSGYALGSDDKKIDKFLKDLARQNNFDNLFMKFEFILSKYGLSVLFFDDLNIIRFANPIFPIYVQTKGEIPISMQFLETSRGWFANDYYKMITANFKGISISSSFAITANAGFYNNEKYASDDRQLEKFIKSNKQIDAVYCQNFPEFNAMIFSLNFRTPDSKNIPKSFYEDLKVAYDALIEDIYISQNKIVSSQKIEIPYQDAMPERHLKILKGIILRNPDTRTIGGKEAKTEFLKASPNAGILWENVWNLWEYGLTLSGYSSTRGASAYSTATENRFSRDLDLITTEQKRKFRQNQWTELFDKILIKNGLWDGKDRKPYYFVISDNAPNDKESGLNRTKMMEDFGYISHSDAIQRMFPNLTSEEIKQKMDKIVEERKKYPEFDIQDGVESIKSQEQKQINPDEKVSEKQGKANSDFHKKEN